jgi:NAD(P)-dependent dehydrogenase (short-subunit alcohol dehydrogenase family)
VTESQSRSQNWLALQGATGVIMGATGGLGRSIARTMSDAGMRLFVHGRSNQSGLEDLKVLPGVERTAVADVRSYDEVREMAAAVGKWCGGRLDAFVYAVGVNPTAAPLNQLALADWDLTMEVNLRGAFLATQALMEYLTVEESGHIVLIASIFGLQSPANRAAYGASKHGMTGLVQTLVREEGSRLHINALAPGPAWGENVRHIFAQHAKREGISVEEYTQSRTSRIPMRRFLNPDELADTVLFLCSSRSSYINGQVIPVTGGAYE